MQAIWFWSLFPLYAMPLSLSRLWYARFTNGFRSAWHYEWLWFVCTRFAAFGCRTVHNKALCLQVRQCSVVIRNWAPYLFLFSHKLLKLKQNQTSGMGCGKTLLQSLLIKTGKLSVSPSWLKTPCSLFCAVILPKSVPKIINNHTHTSVRDKKITVGCHC